MRRLNQWTQIGGDINPGAHGGIIARRDADGSIEVLEIQPVVDSVGETEATEVGFPFWTREAYYSAEELTPEAEGNAELLAQFDASDLPTDPESMALLLAEERLRYGLGTDGGDGGWARDVVPGRVQWWASKRPRGWRFLADEDAEFRRMLREAR